MKFNKENLVPFLIILVILCCVYVYSNQNMVLTFSCLFSCIISLLILYIISDKKELLELPELKIPKIIYMCHKEIHDIKIHSENWKRLNPDFEIELYDDNRCEEFFRNSFPAIYLEIFQFLQDGPIKADFWRLCILYTNGGIYVDADIEPLKELSTFIEPSDDFVTCLSSNFNSNRKIWNMNPHFILATKGHYILKSCMDKYVMEYQQKVPYSYWGYSICKFIEFDFHISEKKSQVIEHNNKRFKFILELPSKNDCEYNGEIVFRNRYKFYRKHNFSRKKEIRYIKKQLKKDTDNEELKNRLNELTGET